MEEISLDNIDPVCYRLRMKDGSYINQYEVKDGKCYNRHWNENDLNNVQELWGCHIVVMGNGDIELAISPFIGIHLLEGIVPIFKYLSTMTMDNPKEKIRETIIGFKLGESETGWRINARGELNLWAIQK